MRRALVAGALCAALAACGSTVPVDERGVAMAGSGDGLSVSPVVAGDEGSTSASSSGGSAGSSTPSTGRTGTAAPSSGSSAAGGTSGGTAPASEGAPFEGADEPLRVGVLYIDGVDQAASALGISGLATGDPKAQAAAVIEWINANGGVAGRTVEPVYVGMSAGEVANNQQLAHEEACLRFTEDEQVSFVVSYVQVLPSTMECYADAGVALIDDQAGLTDDAIAQYAAFFAAPGDFAPGRMLRELVDALWRTGWLTKDSVVGAYHFDRSEVAALVEQALVPALARHGVRLAERAAVSSSAEGVAESSNVVVRFRAAGVDRVIPVLASPLFLMQGASSQGYRPKYATYSLFGPGALLETAAPRDQLEGSAGIGWSPYLDIGRGTKSPPVSENETRCFEIYAEAGLESTSATTKGLQLAMCNVLLYLKHAGDAVGGAPPDLMARAQSVVGSSFAPADTFRSDVTGRPDGAAAYRDLTFDGGCGCYQYTSDVTPAG